MFETVMARFRTREIVGDSSTGKIRVRPAPTRESLPIITPGPTPPDGRVDDNVVLARIGPLGAPQRIIAGEGHTGKIWSRKR